VSRIKASIGKKLIKSQEPMMKNNHPKKLLLCSEILMKYNPQSGPESTAVDIKQHNRNLIKTMQYII
jgi:hypothetical protein